jgi:DNA-binding NarL/FixJ family response regulator
MRVAVAEDSVLFREGLIMLLRAAGYQVVGWASNGHDAIALLEREPVDVVILDIRMSPEPDGGLSTAATVRRRYPDMGLLLLSNYAESHYLMRMLDIGTERIGYRLKDKIVDVQALSDTLRRVAEGEVVIEPEIAQRLVTQPGSAGDALARLSEREVDVLRLMAEGRSNAGIASELYLSTKAVEKHAAAIFTKLGLPADTEAYHRRVLAVIAYLRSQRIEG